MGLLSWLWRLAEPMAEGASPRAQDRPVVVEMNKVHVPPDRNAGTLDALGFLRSVRHRATHAQLGDVWFAPDHPSRRLTASILLSYRYDESLARALEQFGTGRDKKDRSIRELAKTTTGIFRLLHVPRPASSLTPTTSSTWCVR